MEQPVQRKKKKRAAGIIKIIFHILMISLFLMFSAIAAYAIMQEVKKAKEPIYETVSLREEAAAKAYVWLHQVDDMPFSYEDIRQMLGDLQVTVILTPTGKRGIYTQAVDEASYETCQNSAQEILESAYRETVRHRFSAAGYEEEISDEMLDDLMREAYGVSVPEYLQSCDVQLIPALSDLTELYAGETKR